MKALSMAFLAAAGVSGCVGFSIGDKKASQSSQTDQQAASAADAGADSAAGIDCIVEPTTGKTLCTGIAACPDVVVDHDVYPNCGFRPGSTLALECACNGSLCPLGIASTCEEAAKLLAAQSESIVCLQVSEGRCTE
jgi:hypothetical protein